MLPRGAGPGKGKIRGVHLATGGCHAPEIVLESATQTDYQATIQNNTGGDVTGAVLQSYVRQGTALYGAGGIAAGTLVTGPNTINWQLVASNSNGGSGGPLVPGAATFILQLIDASNTVVDSREVAITLAAQ
jgi:hypothetical protein